MPILGDLPSRVRQSIAASSPSVPSTNTATPVQTVVDVKPVDSGVSESKQNQPNLATGNNEASNELNAHYVGDAVPDGTKLAPNHVFSQTWTIKNPGPSNWPKGCSIKFVGGDNMRNIDMSHPVSVADLERSVETNACPLALEPGRRWDFTVTLKTPNREGKCISYWRLTAPNGVKFGHKLWCDIDVSRQMVQQSSIPSQTDKYPTIQNFCTYPMVPPVARSPENNSSANKPQNATNDTLGTAIRNQCNALMAQIEHNRQTSDRQVKQMLLQMDQARQQASERARSIQERIMAKTTNSVKLTQNNVGPSVSDGAPPAYQATETPASSASAATRSALSEYQLQLMLLEQQNKKRLALARAEQDAYEQTMLATAKEAESKETATATKVKEGNAADVDSKLELRSGQGSQIKVEPADEEREFDPALTEHVDTSSKIADTKEDSSISKKEPVTDDTTKKTDESKVSQSTMIFPKLEKESPVIKDVNEGQEVTGNSKSDGQEELISEVESLKLEDDGETEDEEGFLTDEEYDILDASDEEFLAVAQKGAQK